MLTRRTGRWAIGLATVLAVSGLSTAGANAQSTNAQPGPVTTCASVGVGAKGPAVKTIQTLVGADVDGDFGPLTTAALKVWQHRHDVAVTGVVDVATWAAMPARVARAACGQKAHGTGVAATCSQLTTGASGVAVAVLQKALGVDVDGVFGAATEQAVLAAQ